MLNLLSGEFYKCKKSKSFKICLLGTVGMVIFLYLIFLMADNIQKKEMRNGTGVVVSTEMNTQENSSQFNIEELSILEVVSEFASSGIGILFSTGFVCSWVVNEYKNGAVKNIVGKGYSRTNIFVAKCISSIVSAFIMNFVFFMAMLLTGIAVLGADEINGKFFQDFFGYMGLQLLFCIAFSGIVIAISEISRNDTVGAVISLALIFLSSMATAGLDLLFRMLHLNIKASTYWILDVLAECPMGAIDMDFAGRGISVAVMWIVLSVVLGMIHFQRADIK